MNRNGFLLLALLALAFVSQAIAPFCPDAQALTVNWSSTGNWTAGSPIGNGNSTSQGFNTDAANGAATDVTVTVTNNTGISNPWFAPGVTITNTPITGGVTPAVNSFEIQLNNQSNSTTYVGFQMTFNSTEYTSGVTNVSFTFYDVDSGNTTGSHYIDLITNLQAVALNGTLINPVSVVPANATYATYNATTNIIIGNQTQSTLAGNEDDATNRGNVQVSFGSQVITGFVFRYGDSVTTNGTQQRITVSNVNYDRVFIPEIGSGFTAVTACAFLALWQINLRRRSS